MRFLDSLISALDALRGNLMRSALTALGIVIGVAAVLAMVAVGAGAERQIAAAVESMGSNLLIVANGSRVVAGRQTAQGTWLTIGEEDAEAIAKEIPDVEIAVGSVAGTGQIIYGNKNRSTTLRGTTPQYFEARDWVLGEGRNMTAEEIRGAGKIALLGNTVARDLFGDNSPIGREVRINHVPFMVVGVLARKGPTPWGVDQDDVVYMPTSTAKKRVFGGRGLRGDLVGSITVKVASADRVSTAEKEITELLRRRHKLSPEGPDDFFIRNLAEALIARAQASRIMGNVLASVAAISLIVGGIGIMNIMLVSVTERTREIGTRMAIGAKRSDIALQFLLEAMLLSLIGGLAGVALGMAGSELIARLAGWPVLVGVNAVLVAMLFAAAVGLFFGYYPARRAARLDPIDALRSE
jgi:putative ABC transport system permease protein